MNRLILALTWILAGSGSLIGQTGMVLSLDGTGDFVEVPDATSLNLGATTDFTLECWFRTSNRQAANIIVNPHTANLINKWQAVAFDQGVGWAVVINPPGLLAGTLATGHIQIKRGGGGGLNRRNVCCFNEDQWHHIAWAAGRETGAALNTVRDSLYVDGVLLLAGSGSNSNGDFSTSTSLGIGVVPSDVNGLNYFRGEIDEVRIWNVVRTESQIRATMNDTLGLAYYSKADSGLVAYYRFDTLEDLGIGDDGLADDVRDLSIHGNHGDLKDDAILIGVEDSTDPFPDVFFLSQNYPNPFNPDTTINYQVPQPEPVTLAIFNLLGQTIRTLVDERVAPGFHFTTWDGRDQTGKPVASGVYIYRLSSGNFVQARKLMLLR